MFDIIDLLKSFGYIALLFITFAESGIFIGFFLPGDSLLFSAGFLASQGHLNIIWVLVLSFIGAVAGDSVGYTFGRQVGPRLFRKKDSILFHKDHLKRAQAFYEKHGGKTIILARFLPFIRTFAPIVAGIGSMKYSQFAFYNVLGGFLWAVGLSLAGYFLGSLIPNIDRFLIPIILLIIALTSLPGIIHVLANPTTRTAIWKFIKKIPQ